MKLNAYSIYDSAAGAYMSPFFLHNDAQAVRAFQDNINAKEPNNVSLHPDHFTLFHVGTFDDQDAAYIPSDHVKSLGNGLEFVKEDPEYKEWRDEIRQEFQTIRKLLEERK